MANKAVQTFSSNLKSALDEKNLPFAVEVSKVFSQVALGSVENITSMIDKSDERKHKEVLEKIESDFKKTELYVNLNKVGLDTSKEIILQCLSFYEKALDSCKELEVDLRDLIININEDKDIRIEAMKERSKLQEVKLNSTNDLTKTAIKGTLAMGAMALVGFLGKRSIEAWEYSNKPWWKK